MNISTLESRNMVRQVRGQVNQLLVSKVNREIKDVLMLDS